MMTYEEFLYLYAHINEIFPSNINAFESLKTLSQRVGNAKQTAHLE